MKFPTEWKNMESHRIHVPNHQPVINNHGSLNLMIVVIEADPSDFHFHGCPNLFADFPMKSQGGQCPTFKPWNWLKDVV